METSGLWLVLHEEGQGINEVQSHIFLLSFITPKQHRHKRNTQQHDIQKKDTKIKTLVFSIIHIIYNEMDAYRQLNQLRHRKKENRLKPCPLSGRTARCPRRGQDPVWWWRAWSEVVLSRPVTPQCRRCQCDRRISQSDGTVLPPTTTYLSSVNTTSKHPVHRVLKLLYSWFLRYDMLSRLVDYTRVRQLMGSQFRMTWQLKIIEEIN